MTEIEDTSFTEIEEQSPSASKASHPVLDHFKTVDLFKQTSSCKLCGWTCSGTSIRRKLEHILCTGTGSAKKCSTKDPLPLDVQEELLDSLKILDNINCKKKRKQALAKKTIAELPLPKRQRKLTFVTKEDKDVIDMQYGRCLIMNAVKTNFMESSFTFHFFEVSGASYCVRF